MTETRKRRTKLERETTVIFNDGEADAHLWTASRVQARRWERLGLTVSVKGGGWTTSVPKRCIRVKSPFIRKTLSARHKAALFGGRRKIEMQKRS